MIKFFRNIRQNLVTQNKFTKYIIYAVGEIILVIVGILIALSINNGNEAKKARKKVDAILINVMDELATDIESSSGVLLYYQKKDSLSSMILNTFLEYEDYANFKNRALHDVETGYRILATSQNSYDALMQNIDLVPADYDNILEPLHQQYKFYRLEILNGNKALREYHHELNTYRAKEYDWFSKARLSPTKASIDYKLKDPEYKNYIYLYGLNTRTNYIPDVIWYRINAIKAYKGIAKTLEVATDSVSFIYSSEALEKYTGTYRINGSQLQYDLKIEEGRLMMTFTEISTVDEPFEIYPISSSVFINSDFEWFTFQLNDSIPSLTYSIGHFDSEYEKVDSTNIISNAAQVFEEIPLAKAAKEKYVGKYEIVPDVFMYIKLEENILSLWADDQNMGELLAYEENKFFQKDDAGQFEFKIEDGKVKSLVLNMIWDTIEAKKVN